MTMTYAARNGHFDLIKILHDDDDCPRRNDFGAGAARSGNLELLKWMKDQEYIPDDEFLHISELAFEYGHVHVMEWLLEISQLSVHGYYIRRCVLNNNVHVFEWMEKKGIEFPYGFRFVGKYLFEAVSGGHLAMLKWIQKRFEIDSLSPHLGHALIKDNKELVKWAMDNGHPLCEKNIEDIVAITSTRGWQN
jgi:hypothetical protein